MKSFVLTSICMLLCLGASLSAQDAPKPNDLFGPDQGNAGGDMPPDRVAQEKQKKQRRGGDQAGRPPGGGPSPEDLQAIFDKLDTDANGSISPEEFANLMEAQKAYGEEKRAAHQAEMIEKYDGDGDGKLNEEEKKAAAKAMHTERMMKHMETLKEKNPEKYAELDANSDGKIDEAELADMQAKQLDRLNEQAKKNPELMAKADKNQDGSIDADEAREMRKMRQKMGKDGQKRQKGDKRQKKQK